ncbi:hypothetical protein B0T21DRAFT_397599 [Apiosordaria backusii]|uniref:Secreted protein n=1 Tax=Apiosordaria backusii TaxID=314023 RepID=A0AA40DHV1_9PEZI|nr:hypothetical protein B0T21DRAFT_397599 [Apiosordaria backusii]
MQSLASLILAGLLLTLGLFPQSTSAADILQVHNHCNFPLYWWHSAIAEDPNACDRGVNGQCIGKGGEPFEAQPGQTYAYPWWKNDKGVSAKIRRGDKVPNKYQLQAPVFQFEYCHCTQGEPWDQGLWWDLSDIDGGGPGLYDSPFNDQNVYVQVTGAGSADPQYNTCRNLKCKKNERCENVYQEWDDPDARRCPLNTGEIHLHMCMSDAEFGSAPLKFRRDAIKIFGRGARVSKRQDKGKVTIEDLRKGCLGIHAALAKSP